MTLAASALAQLATWPDLAEAEPSCGMGRALRTAHGEIAHFHSDDHVDLYLTARAIRQFEEHLAAATAVQLVPGSQWVTLRLDVTADVHLLMTLVSLALQMRQAWPVQGNVPRAECNDQRSAVRPRENLGGG
ncbi:luciferase domain-containing protein [Streptomyces phaeochromogenes]|uniref:luciferase domain-containing protein n=1 Tax=Streptomyces phaeochromogenes TaxID=1923 RepID=UPI00368372D9